MKRICLFAGYDSKNIIHDYVVFYLKELSTVADVYYMADNEISDDEKSKIAPYVKASYGFNHKKYDFGSWQELIKIIGWEKLSEYDELILANDSVFGPLYPIKELFEKLEQDKEWHICGINKAVVKNIWHISSYFLVFKKKAFLSDIFKRHMESITIEKNSLNVINKYEIPFMEKFYQNNYIVKSFISENVDIYIQWNKFIEYGSPFIKKRAFITKHMQLKNIKWDKIILEYSNYPINLIQDYIKKTKSKYSIAGIIIRNIKIYRKKLFSINIKKHKKHIKIFGYYLLKKENKANNNNNINISNICQIKTIQR